MPKIILSIPLSTFGLLKITTFIDYLRQRLQQDIPSIITHIASIPTKNFGGQKQLISNPKAKTMPIMPLLVLLFFLRIFIPPILHNNQKIKFCYNIKEKRSVYNKKQTLNLFFNYLDLQRDLTSLNVSVISLSGFLVSKLTAIITAILTTNAGSNS